MGKSIINRIIRSIPRGPRRPRHRRLRRRRRRLSSRPVDRQPSVLRDCAVRGCAHSCMAVLPWFLCVHQPNWVQPTWMNRQSTVSRCWRIMLYLLFLPEQKSFRTSHAHGFSVLISPSLVLLIVMRSLEKSSAAVFRRLRHPPYLVRGETSCFFDFFSKYPESFGRPIGLISVVLSTFCSRGHRSSYRCSRDIESYKTSALSR
jgi:hypothetical protein